MPAINLVVKLMLYVNEVEDFFLVNPLSSDKQNYFVSKKQLPKNVIGEYNYQSKRYTCKQDYKNDCMAFIDNGRGQFNYHTNFYWAVAMSALPDGKFFGFSLGEGNTPDDVDHERFTEDYISFDGKVYKMDQTLIKFNPDNLDEEIKLETIKENK